ncbi:uncharacterized protein LOC127807298 [Diospyros lotus]|uniref:uncharacterized protein LOC127807298 n=1 Tax=Diospyros lotus TaxID=55363 RepID=UPI002259E57B|nr:uncharacterized protein LOC127807298 [Diospyros lotus]
MALKFLNKKGWHTGSLRNIENVWKAEQKHEAEQKKSEELRKQIQEERERSEFRLLQQQAGLVPTQERLDFLYDSGLAVGKGSSSDGFRALELESFPKTKSDPHTPSSSSSTKQQPSVPGALFDEKPHSSNDAWRKLHSDPLLLIRQREQEALARVKNNPIQMAMIRKSVEAKKHKEKICGSKKSQDKHHRKKSNHQKHSSPGRDLDSENASVEREERRYSNCNSSKYERSDKVAPWLERELNERNTERKRNLDEDIEPKRHPATSKSGSAAKTGETQDGSKRNSDKSKRKKDYLEGHLDTDSGGKGKKDHRSCQERRESHRRHWLTPFKLSEEERAARLQEMQVDAKLHEDQRWKRLKQADENDAREATSSSMYSGKNFLHASQRSVYGAENGGSSTIEESVRRRTHYSQRRSEASEGNAFRR